MTSLNAAPDAARETGADSPDVFWFLPTHGDSRYLGTSRGARTVDGDYLRQVAVAADTLGYDGVLLPTGRSCEDAWIVASSLIHETRKLKFLVAVRPGLSTPGLALRHNGICFCRVTVWIYSD